MTGGRWSKFLDVFLWTLYFQYFTFYQVHVCSISGSNIFKDFYCFISIRYLIGFYVHSIYYSHCSVFYFATYA